MASLFGAIGTFFLSDPSASAARELLQGSFYSDEMPPRLDRPFCVVRQAAEEQRITAKARTQFPTAIEVTVAFDVVANGRAELEAIIEALQEVFVDQQPILTITDRTHIGTLFSNATKEWDGVEGWMGTLFLKFQLRKN